MSQRYANLSYSKTLMHESAASSHNESRSDKDLEGSMRLSGIILNHPHHIVSHHITDHGYRLLDTGYGRIEEIQKTVVVKGYDSHIIRDTHPKITYRLDGAQEDRVAECKDSVRAIIGLKSRHSFIISVLDGE